MPENQPEKESLQRYWWVFLVRGFSSLFFGLVAFLLWPLISEGLIKFFFGSLAILEGLLLDITVLAVWRREKWAVTFVQGTAGIVIGILAFLLPSISKPTMLILVGLWIILGGTVLFYALLKYGQRLQGRPLITLTGLATMALGLILFIDHGSGMVNIVWVFGLGLMIVGMLMLSLSIKCRLAENT